MGENIGEFGELMADRQSFSLNFTETLTPYLFGKSYSPKFLFQII